MYRQNYTPFAYQILYSQIQAIKCHDTMCVLVLITQIIIKINKKGWGFLSGQPMHDTTLRKQHANASGKLCHIFVTISIL